MIVNMTFESYSKYVKLCRKRNLCSGRPQNMGGGEPEHLVRKVNGTGKRKASGNDTE